jgi:hypothetical protein
LVEHDWPSSKEPDEQIVLNMELTDLGQFATASLIVGIAHALILRRLLTANRPIPRT